MLGIMRKPKPKDAVKTPKLKTPKLKKGIKPAPVEVENRELTPREIRKEVRSILLDKVMEETVIKEGDVAKLVKLYYDAQGTRTKNEGKIRSMGESPLTIWFLTWLSEGEKQIAKKLDQWVTGDNSPEECKWAYSQWGIGPIIASGLAAHINVEKAKHISSVWKYAGYAPGADRRVKGQKLPYCGPLKLVCWKLGDSFMKISGKEDAFYGQEFKKFKAREIERNNAGEYKKQADRELRTKDIKDAPTLERLRSGKLTDGHLNERAKRLTIKLFLAHYWVVARKARKLPVSKPYAFEDHDGTGFKKHDQTSYVPPPN